MTSRIVRSTFVRDAWVFGLAVMVWFGALPTVAWFVSGLLAVVNCVLVVQSPRWLRDHSPDDQHHAEENFAAPR